MGIRMRPLLAYIFACTCLLTPVVADAVDIQIEQDEPHIIKPKETKEIKEAKATAQDEAAIAEKQSSDTPSQEQAIVIPEKTNTAEKDTETVEVETANIPQPKPTPPYLPPFSEGDLAYVGTEQTYVSQAEDTLLDIARYFGLGFVELQVANSNIDPWAIMPGTEIKIPTRHILPRAEQTGIIVNLADMRIYYFDKEGQAPTTFPVGIGREGLQTPQGQTTIVRKKDGPSWYPTERMREENPDLPAVVPAGPANPLGTHALYLGWPTFLIHGTNKPWGIGRRVSSGCIRMYPENIANLFKITPTGTKVQVVEQAIKMAWFDDGLFIEIHPEPKQTYRIEETGQITETATPMPENIKAWLRQTAEQYKVTINWDIAEAAYQQKQGIPVKITHPEHIAKAKQKKPRTSFGNE